MSDYSAITRVMRRLPETGVTHGATGGEGANCSKREGYSSFPERVSGTRFNGPSQNLSISGGKVNGGDGCHTGKAALILLTKSA